MHLQSYLHDNTTEEYVVDCSNTGALEGNVEKTVGSAWHVGNLKSSEPCVNEVVREDEGGNGY
jgi:hypothetical protein